MRQLVLANDGHIYSAGDYLYIKDGIIHLYSADNQSSFKVPSDMANLILHENGMDDFSWSDLEGYNAGSQEIFDLTNWLPSEINEFLNACCKLDIDPLPILRDQLCMDIHCFYSCMDIHCSYSDYITVKINGLYCGDICKKGDPYLIVWIDRWEDNMKIDIGHYKYKEGYEGDDRPDSPSLMNGE